MTINKFIHGDFKEFSNYDNVRSIPSIVDGLKLSQRKAVYGLFKHGTKEIKVAQLAAYAAMVSHYAHGEQSMCDTIVGLAQDYTGSNNINLFEPVGQFGSILSSDAASPRYIFTKQSEWLRKMFKHDDDNILVQRKEEGQLIEPEHYYPVLPLCLINGAVGIGTGFATKILNYNPKELAKYIQAKLEGKPVKKKLTPYYKGYKGKVVKTDNTTVFTGCFERVNTTTMLITELPIGYDIDKYKKILLSLIESGVIKDYDNNSTDEGFEFVVNAPRTTLSKSDEWIIDKFKLRSQVTENYTLWDDLGFLTVYESAEEIVDTFIEIREELYERRRLKLIEILGADLKWLNEKARFIMYWNTHGPRLCRMNRRDLTSDLKSSGFEEIERLLGLKIHNLTADDAGALDLEIRKLEKEKKRLEKLTASDMFSSEVVEFT